MNIGIRVIASFAAAGLAIMGWGGKEVASSYKVRADIESQFLPSQLSTMPSSRFAGLNQKWLTTFSQEDDGLKKVAVGLVVDLVAGIAWVTRRRPRPPLFLVKKTLG